MNISDTNFGLIADIAIDKILYSYDYLYSYYIPDSFEDMIKAGSRVVVPFGRGNRKHIGVVMSLKKVVYDPKRTKQIIRIADDNVIISEEMLYLIKWLKANTFCTYFEAIKLILPAGMRLNITEKYFMDNSVNIEDLTVQEKNLYNFLVGTKTKREFDECLNCSGNPSKQQVVNSLVKKGILTEVSNVKQKIQDLTVKMVRINDEYFEDIEKYQLTAKQKQVVDLLTETTSASVKEVCYSCSVTSAVIKNLLKQNILSEFEYEVLRVDTENVTPTKKVDDITLNETQTAVYNGLLELMQSNKPECALLRGVTGSGKTSVFFKIIDSCLKMDKSAIVLVPEISLTPQMVRVFQELFGSLVAVIHSNLSLGQRMDEYKRITSGSVKIVIGTRSAIFAPLSHIGVIIIDEESEFTYKSERSPRYHAHEVAKQRCFRHNCLLLLASATPSVVSYHYAKVGRYKLFEMEERYSGNELPEVYIVDMAVETENGNNSMISSVLAEEIDRNLTNNEQTMLLLNRRGFYTHTACLTCGAVAECPNCNIPLTYHKVNDSLICHYCGYHKKMEACECGSKMVNGWGTGTQRIEDELKLRFPNAKILRMDADTTISKNAFATKFTGFGNGEYDIMLGTQMIAKGLDFENVTLVGVLEIDKALYAGDYTGYEKTFSLITQVVGRCGRGGKTGRAYLQTFTKDHYVLNQAAKQDYVSFYEGEAEIRRTLLFPPFCDIYTVGFSSLIEIACETAAHEFVNLLVERIGKESIKVPIRVLGPSKFSIGKINGRFRNRIIIKCKNNARFRSIVDDVIISASKSKIFTNVSFYCDINGELN